MNTRRIGIIVVTAHIIMALSYWGVLADWADSLIPVRVNVASIEAADLVTRPQAEVGIQLFEERTKQNPQDAVSLSILGQLYAQQAWESDDTDLYAQAVETQQQALTLLPDYDPAEISLAGALLALHEFEEARTLAQAIYDNDPKRTDALAMAGDASLALGRYEEADSIYKQLQAQSPSPQVKARMAHLAELTGDREGAIALMQRATKQALEEGQDKGQIAWYLFRLGDLYFDVGRFDEAQEYLEASLSLRSSYVAPLDVLAEVAVAAGNYEEAIALYEESLTLSESLGTLAALGDLYTLTDQPGKAKSYYQAIEENYGQLAQEKPAIYGRELADYYVNHDLRLNEALALIQDDLERRQDIQGYDLAAWAYYKLGQYDKAQEMMSLALQLGTKDAEMLYHAGMIAEARGETAEAIRLLTQALQINPAFDPIQVDITTKTLDALQS